MSREHNSRRRRLGFRLLAIMLSLLPFAMVELGLRLFVAERGQEAVDTDPLVNLENLSPLFELDSESGTEPRWIIPEHRLSFFRPDSFLAAKPPGSKRIFVLGGSTVQGNPYSIETAFSTWLRLRLEAADPKTRYEVVNCGGVSYASYRVAHLLNEVLTHQPDAIVLYTGHNEFLETRSYETLRRMTPSRQVIARFASQFRIVRDAKRFFGTAASDPQVNRSLDDKADHKADSRTTLAREVDARLDHPRGLEPYRRDPNWIRDVETHFAITLRRIAVACERASVPLVVCVPASDLVMTPPFKVELAPTLNKADRERFAEQWTLATTSDQDTEVSFPDRQRACESCLAIDRDHAGANYLMGRWAFDRDQPDVAGRYLQHARDQDVCPLRATSSIVNATWSVIDEFNLPHVDVITLLDQRDPNGNKIPDKIPDPEFFADHVHPTIVAHQMIGESIAEALADVGWCELNEESRPAYVQACAAKMMTLDESYYTRGRERLEGLKRWAAGRAASVGEEL